MQNLCSFFRTNFRISIDRRTLVRYNKENICSGTNVLYTKRRIIMSGKVVAGRSKYFIQLHKNRKAIGLLFLLAAAIYIIIFLPAKIAYANPEVELTRSYKTIEIQAGDSLWSIAEDHYCDSKESIQEYISLVKQCNSLYEDEITAGCYLVIPYYNDL